MIYEKKNIKQVEIQDIDDKHTYTVCINSITNRDLLPF